MKEMEFVFSLAQRSRINPTVAGDRQGKINTVQPKGAGNGLERTLRLQEGAPAVHWVPFPFQTQVMTPGPSSWCAAEHWKAITVPTAVPLPCRICSVPSWGGTTWLHCAVGQKQSQSPKRRSASVSQQLDCKPARVTGQELGAGDAACSATHHPKGKQTPFGAAQRLQHSDPRPKEGFTCIATLSI